MTDHAPIDKPIVEILNHTIHLRSRTYYYMVLGVKLYTQGLG